MAKVYSPPEELKYEPDYSIPIEEHIARDEEYIKKLAEFCKKNTNQPSSLVGEIIRFPAGDGAAQYMVYNNTSLIYIPTGDAWQAYEATLRGLRAIDIKQMVNQNKKRKQLFG